MTRLALNCARCDRELINVDETATNQPDGGTAFETHGHYGSTAFDPMDGSIIEVSFCDECLTHLRARPRRWRLLRHVGRRPAARRHGAEVPMTTEHGQSEDPALVSLARTARELVRVELERDRYKAALEQLADPRALYHPVGVQQIARKALDHA